MYENFKCWKYNSENGWVELQNMLLPTITWYMNWWGSYDPNPNNLHLPGGMTSLQIHAVFEQLKALIVETIMFSPEINFSSDEVLQGLCYFVNYKNQIDEDAQVLPFLKDNNIFCYYGHSTNGNILNLTTEENPCIDDLCTILPNEISENNVGNSSYKFVYLCCCYAGIFLNEWKSAFNTNCILSFSDNINLFQIILFEAEFWNRISVDHESVFTAAYHTKEKYPSLPISVLGDVLL